MPYLSSSRPSIAHLFPQEPGPDLVLLHERPAAKAGNYTTATSGRKASARLKLRPLPPPPADEVERSLSRKSPNPFVSSGTSELNVVERDDPFAAFASCRLQSADSVAAGSEQQKQQPEPRKQPEQNSLLELWDTDYEEPPQTKDAVKDSAVNEASRPQNWDICLDPFRAQLSDGFAQLLTPATNQQASMLLTASLDSAEKDGGCAAANLANYSSNTDFFTSTAPSLALCHNCQYVHNPSLPCETDKLMENGDLSNPSSSGVGSLADEDVLSSICSCSASEKSASLGDDTETKGVIGCTLNPCEGSCERTAVSVMKDSEEKLIDWSFPLVGNHNVEGNLIQESGQNEKRSVILMDERLVPLTVISLVELQHGDGPSKEPGPPHVPLPHDLSSNVPNISNPSDLELEPMVSVQCVKSKTMEVTCELQESFGDLHKSQNISVLAANKYAEALTPDIMDTDKTLVCPSFHTVTSFLCDESSLLERLESLDKHLFRHSSPKPSELLAQINNQTMTTPIQVLNESSLTEIPFSVRSSGERLVQQSSPKPSELLTIQKLTTHSQVLDDALSIEPWLTPSPGSLIGSLYASTDSQQYQTCLTQNSSTGTTVSVDSLAEHPSENLCSSVLTLCGAEGCDEIGRVLSPEELSAPGLHVSVSVCGLSDAEPELHREAGAELFPSEEVSLSEEMTTRLEPGFTVENFGFGSDTLTDSDNGCRHDNSIQISGEGTQENEGELSKDTFLSPSRTQCPALQRSHSEGTLGTGFSEPSLTSSRSNPSVVQSLHPNDPSGPPYLARAPLRFLSPASCLPAEPSASLACCALPSTTAIALPVSPLPAVDPAPEAPPPSPCCIPKPVPDDACAADKAHVTESHGPPEVPPEEVERPPISPHPVRPLTSGPEERRGPEGRSALASGLEKLRSTIHPGKSSQLSEAEPERRKSLTEGAGSYYHLNQSQLVALLVRREAELERQRAECERQTAVLSRREVELRRLKPQVRDLENYIDTLLVRIMEQTPTLLQVRSKFK